MGAPQQALLMAGSLSPVVVLLHFDGDLVNVGIGPDFLAWDGATGFTSTNAKFTQSVSIGGAFPDGGGASCVYSGGGSLFDLNSGDFCIDFWVRPNTNDVPRPRVLLRVADGITDEYQILIGSGTDTYSAALNISSGVPTNLAGPSIAANTWAHCALTREGDVARFFINGIQQSTYTTSYRNPAGSKTIYIGNNTPGFIDAFSGLIDEVRVVKGQAIWTANFTPPTAAYPNP